MDGCWWHWCPEHRTVPKANREWWIQKLEANRARDTETDRRLIDQGWLPLRFWEHEDPVDVANKIAEAVRRRRG